MSKRNWDRIRSQTPSESLKNRDVYEDQQLERGEISEKQSPLSRIILTSILTILVFAFTYVLASIFQFGIAQIKSVSNGDTSSIVIDTGQTSQSQVASEVDDVLGPDWVQPEYSEDFTPDGIQYTDADGRVFSHEPTRSDYVQIYKDEHGITDDEPDSVLESASSQIEQETTAAIDTSDDSVSVMSGFAAIPYYFKPSLLKILISLVISVIFASIMWQVMIRNLKAQNMLSDTADINQYHNDQHIALPEEVQRKFDWFPDVGAHSNVQVSSMISHMALVNKGINPVDVAKRATEDIVDEDGDIEYYKGEVLLDDDSNPITVRKPMIDEKFMDALFEASGAPDDKMFRKYYDTTKIPYNPGGKDRTKQGGKWDTVAEMINHDWVFPAYEPQRPAGAYVVDTEPVNTMVLAITRAGKGQTVIECWLCLSLLQSLQR